MIMDDGTRLTPAARCTSLLQRGLVLSTRAIIARTRAPCRALSDPCPALGDPCRALSDPCPAPGAPPWPPPDPPGRQRRHNQPAAGVVLTVERHVGRHIDDRRR